VQGVPAKRVNPSAYQDQKRTHWARKAGSQPHQGNVDKIQKRTDVVKPRTSLPRRNK
jgi:hypothetical protein